MGQETCGKVSMGEVLTLTACGLLSPMIRVLPQYSAQIAGRAGWLAALAAAPPMMGTLWLMLSTRRRLPQGEGLGGWLIRAFGRLPGRALCGLYLLWLLAELCGALRLYGERFISTTYRDASPALFFVVLLALELWMSHGTLAAFSRMGRIFLNVLGVTVVLSLALSWRNIDWLNLLPLWWDCAPAAAASALPAAASLGVGFSLLFLDGQVRRGPADTRNALAWMGGFCLLNALMSLVIIGCFGAGLASRMQVPFFTLVKETRVFGALDRVESLVVAVWVITDILFIGLMLRAACAAMECAFGLHKCPQLATPLLFFMFPGGFLAAESMYSLSLLYEQVMPWVQLVMAYGIPVLACLSLRLKLRRGGV